MTATPTSVLVIDVGTTGARAAVVRDDASLGTVHYRHLPPDTPFPGMVEFDAVLLASTVLDLATAALAESGPVAAVGVSTQRASTVVWDRVTGVPVGPAIGWQDLRTVFDCITAKSEHGFALAPNQSATKLQWLLNTYDPDRSRDLCFGTVDSWIAWTLTGGAAANGALHVTDRSNAAVSGLSVPDASEWSSTVCTAFRVPESMLPTLVDTSGIIGPATALPGAPLLACLVGDQQASLVGQSCVRHGDVKITFGTGGMLDMCLDDAAPATANRSKSGTFPIVAWSREGRATWGIEAIMLAAGTNVEWLRDDLGIIATAAESHDVASRCATSDGVVYVPALLGIGTPNWDYGARGGLFGLTRGSGRPQIVRAVLEGVAHRGADLVDAAVAQTGHALDRIRIDGGMTANPTFVQAVADATQLPVEVSPITEATTLGAGYLAGLAVGVWGSLDDIADSWRPSAVVHPQRVLDRDQWAQAVQRAGHWIPDLSALDF